MCVVCGKIAGVVMAQALSCPEMRLSQLTRMYIRVTWSQAAGERILVRLFSGLIPGGSSHPPEATKELPWLSSREAGVSTPTKRAATIDQVPLGGLLKGPSMVYTTTSPVRNKPGLATSASCLRPQGDKPVPLDGAGAGVAGVNGHIIKQRVVTMGKAREWDNNVRAIEKLLIDSLFKFPAQDLFGPLLVQHLTPAVLDRSAKLIDT